MFWLAVVGGLNYGLEPLGFDYENGYLLCSCWFLFFAGVCLYRYRVKELLAHHARFHHQFLYIGALTALALIIGFLIAENFPISPEKVFEIRSTHVLFPLFLYKTWITKLADITFQQSFIFALLKELQRETQLSKKQIVHVAGCSFALLHLPLVVLLGVYGFYFIVPSVFAGFLFNWFIMNFRHGIFYSYALHLIFYVLMGIALRYY